MRPKVGIVIGYFDWFSGYQETALATGLARYADVEVIAGNRVSPIFSDMHLQELGHDRAYAPVDREPQHGVLVTRLPVREIRSMVWSTKVGATMKAREFDLVIQVMPGQGLSIAPSIYRGAEKRIALYGDNSAMWSALPSWQQRLKWLVFFLTKGRAYSYVNRRSSAIYAYTPETIRRLSAFQKDAEIHVMALTFREEEFSWNEASRSEWRSKMRVADSEILIVTAGKQQPYKRLEDLLTAVAVLSERHANLRLALAGSDESPYSRTLRRQAEEDSRLHDRVSFLPFLRRAQLNAFFNAGDVGAWPHLPAISIQQALGTGLYTVLPANAAVEHLLVDESVGQYFPPGTVNGLIEGLEQALTVDRSSGGRHGRAERNTWLSADKLAKLLLERHLGRDRES